ALRQVRRVVVALDLGELAADTTERTGDQEEDDDDRGGQQPPGRPRRPRSTAARSRLLTQRGGHDVSSALKIATPGRYARTGPGGSARRRYLMDLFGTVGDHPFPHRQVMVRSLAPPQY